MAMVQVPKVDSLLKDLTDEQIIDLLKKAFDEFRGAIEKRDINRTVEILAAATACERKAERRGGQLAEWLRKKLTEDLP